MKLIKIGAIWCSGCIIMNNILADLTTEYNLEIKELDYDYDEETKKYNVGKILPVIIVLNAENREIKRIVGEKSKKELISILDHLKGEL